MNTERSDLPLAYFSTAINYSQTFLCHSVPQTRSRYFTAQIK